MKVAFFAHYANEAGVRSNMANSLEAQWLLGLTASTLRFEHLCVEVGCVADRESLRSKLLLNCNPRRPDFRRFQGHTHPWPT